MAQERAGREELAVLLNSLEIENQSKEREMQRQVDRMRTLLQDVATQLEAERDRADFAERKLIESSEAVNESVGQSLSDELMGHVDTVKTDELRKKVCVCDIFVLLYSFLRAHTQRNALLYSSYIWLFFFTYTYITL